MPTELLLRLLFCKAAVPPSTSTPILCAVALETLLPMTLFKIFPLAPVCTSMPTVVVLVALSRVTVMPVLVPICTKVAPLARVMPVPPVFAWTGVVSLFEAAGYQRLRPAESHRAIYVKKK